ADDQRQKRTGRKSPSGGGSRGTGTGCGKGCGVSDSGRSNSLFHVSVCTQAGPGGRLSDEDRQRRHFFLRRVGGTGYRAGGKFPAAPCDPGVLSGGRCPETSGHQGADEGGTEDGTGKREVTDHGRRGSDG